MTEAEPSNPYGIVTISWKPVSKKRNIHEDDDEIAAYTGEGGGNPSQSMAVPSSHPVSPMGKRGSKRIASTPQPPHTTVVKKEVSSETTDSNGDVVKT